MQKLNKSAVLATLAAAGMAVGTAANAAAVDVSAVTTDIGAQAAPVAAIGGAVLLIVVAVAAFKWVKRAIS